MTDWRKDKKVKNSCPLETASHHDLCQAYRHRLGLSNQPLPPTFDTLCLITERHLERIPFTNLSLHLDPPTNDPPVVLDESILIKKVLLQGYGACCLELNGLLARFLIRLGYDVHLVPTFVAAGRERGHTSTTQPKFRTTQSHFVLLVDRKYILDVGLGEPPLHPLVYQTDLVQRTPDGMISRIRWDPKGSWTDGQGRSRTCLIQEWQTTNDGPWEPRLQWDVADAPLDGSAPKTQYTLNDFAYVIQLLLNPKSSFARKFIACRLTRTQKITLTGDTLKITSPRFGPMAQSHSTPISTEEAVRLALLEHFDIALRSDQKIDLTKSNHARNTKLWEHL